ncbi:MAG: alternative ribosome rescue aminoacyl-tRNA hydrolase ArfB [Anaerolineales bacterium]
MPAITSNFSLPDEEIHIEYVHASGPGGQNVNKVSTAAQLRFDVENSPSLADDVKNRLKRLAGKRLTSEGILLLEARRYRSQEQNRFDAENRLAALIRQALIAPKIRRATRPGKTASAARVFAKKQRGALKKIRQYNPEEWE